MPTVHPFLWFDTQAEEAAGFYVSIFPNSRIVDVARYGEGGPGPAGTAMTVEFTLDGSPMVALNGGPDHFGFNQGISFVIGCATPDDVDHYWAALTDGGEEGRCGWLKDRYGLSWQVVPDGLVEVLGDPDPDRARRATQAMFTMTKLDLEAMRRAADAAD
jgi:predicted 3-demethylubiquinone-9 3-methyltransferase (glyoxalase superfamily)